MTTLIKQILVAPNWKVIVYLIFGALAQFFYPIADFIVAIFLLMILDFITGVQAAKKRGEAITSQGWRRTATKVVVYALLIIVCEKIKITYFKDIDLKVSYGVSLSIITIELKSLAENIKTITGVDIWQKLSEFFLPKS
ncbi:phage holin family protein [Arcicella sp. LKC2W]|uniref:phage holin family protein n=1 Tax=Arcicella sp. LKC2W TaxID=2984198 RepID=UPI002B209830|nr:phage holin family protein [Arcicella sp. LKC2W]MEA5459100.1 phage holin family protein [Arcicella sp. LKC2W]